MIFRTRLLDQNLNQSIHGLELDDLQSWIAWFIKHFVLTGLGKSENFYRDVYSSSPEEDELDLESEAADKFIEISVSEPHKIGEGISSYMAYKVTTKTNLKLFRKENFSVTRRFSDFLGKPKRYLLSI